MNWVAEETGGRAFYNRNDLGAAIQEAMRDGDVTYTLGFYSQRDKPDGNFHALKVKVDRAGVAIGHTASMRFDPPPMPRPDLLHGFAHPQLWPLQPIGQSHVRLSDHGRSDVIISVVGRNRSRGAAPRSRAEGGEPRVRR